MYSDRQNGPRLGRWLSIDPKAASFPGVSPYVSMGNNPIMMVDPRGDRVKLNGFNEPEKAMDRAFGLWMVSEEGRDYLSQFAEAGQTLTVGEFSVSFDESGKYHNAGIDAVFTASYMGEGEPSRTPYYRIEGLDLYTVQKDENGRFQVEVLLNKDRNPINTFDATFISNMNNYTYNILVMARIGTILHEAYVHQLPMAEGLFKNPNKYKTWTLYTPNSLSLDTYQNEIILEFGLDGIITDEDAFHLKRLRSEGLSFLQKINIRYNLHLNKYELWQLGIVVPSHVQENIESILKKMKNSK